MAIAAFVALILGPASLSADHTSTPVPIGQETRLFPADPTAGARFGTQTDLVGDTLVIDAESDDDNGPESGSVYVFTHDGTHWSQEAKLKPQDGAAFDHFGRHDLHVDPLGDDTLVVSAPFNDDEGPSSGSAYVFTRSGTVWTERAKLLPTDGVSADPFYNFDSFGYDVAIESGTIAVGARQDDDADHNAGAVYVFTGAGDTWSFAQKLTAADAAASDQFGTNLEMDGPLMVVGATLTDQSSAVSGYAYVFERDGAGVWHQIAKLVPSDGNPGDAFGAAVAISGETVVVGAPYHESNPAEPNTGAVYVYERDGGLWTEQKLEASDAAPEDWFGNPAIDGDRLVVGAQLSDAAGADAGQGYLFERNGAGTWVETARFASSDIQPNDRFSRGPAIQGSTVVMCSPLADAETGAVYVYDLEVDSDGDGIPDEDDACPDQGVGPDADGDGCWDAIEDYVALVNSMDWQTSRRARAARDSVIRLVHLAESHLAAGRIPAARSLLRGAAGRLSSAGFRGYLPRAQYEILRDFLANIMP